MSLSRLNANGKRAAAMMPALAVVTNAIMAPSVISQKPALPRRVFSAASESGVSDPASSSAGITPTVTISPHT